MTNALEVGAAEQHGFWLAGFSKEVIDNRVVVVVGSLAWHDRVNKFPRRVEGSFPALPQRCRQNQIDGKLGQGLNIVASVRVKNLFESCGQRVTKGSS